jgi:hypothetical protein
MFNENLKLTSVHSTALELIVGSGKLTKIADGTILSGRGANFG